MEICGGQQTRSQYVLLVDPSFAVQLTDLVSVFEKYNVRIIVPTIPIVCAKACQKILIVSYGPVTTCNFVVKFGI